MVVPLLNVTSATPEEFVVAVEGIVPRSVAKVTVWPTTATLVFWVLATSVILVVEIPLASMIGLAASSVTFSPSSSTVVDAVRLLKLAVTVAVPAV